MSSLRLNAGTIKLNSPLLHSADLHEVGTHLSLDIFRQTVKSDAVTLFMSAPAFGVHEAVIGSVDITHQPANGWFTVTAAIPSALRDILLQEDTDVRFHIFFNSGGPDVFVDHLHFSRSFESRVPSSPEVPSGLSATLAVTSDWGSGYCASLKLSNSAATPTPGWQVLIDTKTAPSPSTGTPLSVQTPAPSLSPATNPGTAASPLAPPTTTSPSVSVPTAPAARRTPSRSAPRRCSPTKPGADIGSHVRLSVCSPWTLLTQRGRCFTEPLRRSAARE